MLDAPLNRGYDLDWDSRDRPQGEGLRGRAAAQQYRKAAPDPPRISSLSIIAARTTYMTVIERERSLTEN